MSEPAFLLIIALILLGTIAVAVVYLARYLYGKRTVAEVIGKKVVLQISVPPQNDKSPLAAEQLFQSLHGIVKKQERSMHHYSFEIVAVPKGIYFIVVCTDRYRQFVENQIYAQYPNASIKSIRDYTEFEQQHHKFALGSEIELSREYYLPIKTFNSFEVDPLASITGAISKLTPGTEAWVQCVVRPLSNSWQAKGKAYVDHQKTKEDAEGKRVPLESGQSEELSKIETKNTKVGFQFKIRLMAKGNDQILVQQLLDDMEASFKQFQTAHLNSLVESQPRSSLLIKLRQLLLGKRLGEMMTFDQRFKFRFLDEKEDNIINIEELASLYHLPSRTVETPSISWAKSKKVEYPENLPVKQGRIFAMTDFRGNHYPYGIKEEDRKRHMYILGKTGSGKSTVIQNMAVSDIKEGKGVAVIDPHGDLVEDILELIPEERMKDVVYIDPSDRDFPVGLNMLDLKEGETMELLADGLVSVFKKFFGFSWGPRLQYILTNVFLTLLHCQNVSLLAVQRILLDKNYRKFLLKQVDDPFLINFWEKEYEEMSHNQRLLTEAIAPIQNKVGRFLNSPMIRNMIGQVTSSIDLQEIMNEEKILLVNLSQGKIGEENSSLLGGMIVTRLYTNAMQRAFLPEAERSNFYVYVDEFQNFATETFIKILSEARKYGLNLIVTHQYIDQISEEIQKAIFGNIGTLVNFVVGQHDAKRLAEEYTPELTAEDLVNLEKFSVVTKMMIDGSQSKPFTGKTISPWHKSLGNKEKIKEFNRQQYASKREDIEAKLNKWSNQEYNSKGNLLQPQDKKDKSRKN